MTRQPDGAEKQNVDNKSAQPPIGEISQAVRNTPPGPKAGQGHDDLKQGAQPPIGEIAQAQRKG